MATWNIKEFAKLVESLRIPGGQEVAAAAHSLAHKFLLLRVHAEEAETAFDHGFPELQQDVEIPDILDLFFEQGQKQTDFQVAQILYEAHAVAAVGVCHSISDNLAHLIYQALDLPQPDPYRPKIQGVNKALSPGPLKDAVAKLIGLREYRYLQDFSNVNKHISLVEANYHLSTPPNECPRHGVRFKAFTSGGVSHPQKWGSDLLSEIRTIRSAQISIGIELNRLLSEQAGRAS